MKMFKKILLLTGVMTALMIPTYSLAYDVKPGDTMYRIAKEHDMSLQELATLNPQVKNINLIYVGDNINTNKNDKVVVSNNNSNYTEYEKDLLARIIRAEALGEPYAGKVAVGVVVLNRVDSDGFPNSIKEVIYQKGQFTPVSNGSINVQADSESRKAAEEAMRTYKEVSVGSLFFYNPKTATSRWLDSRETTIVIGNHVFKK